ncbi:Inner membrane component of T3SS domain-containing protein [Planctomicrobium piriforme]|uniref:Inner membrane component of T3SS domain-containing protein n=2 Tax=Planctomicrobium piriforme TaxID=1576369 RepID=A0A1I3NKY5_9PLAN|nr:Inner membrane component of T3SS domain-containing protein [Planctomicrobium piriforme]
MLAYAAAAPGPLRLRIRMADGTEQQQEIAAPFAIIGRGAGSDVRLPEQTVSFRHAYLQAIGPRVACIDLLSVAGLNVSGPPFHGWLSPEHVLHIGSSQIQLVGEEWQGSDDLKSPLDFRPRDELRPEFGMLPQVDLELLNTQHQGMKWPINRVITLIGRDDRCRITVADERLSRVQCAMLLLPSGLWVIDLLGKGGVQMNGQACNCGLLSTGAELTIGQYRLTAHYQQVANMAAFTQQHGQSSGGEFLTRPNRIYQTEFYHDTVIVYPVGDAQGFFYQDVHVEASRVCDLVMQRGFNHVVIDFSRADQLSHMVVEGLMSMCRAVSGRSVMCGASETTYAALQTTPLIRLLDHYQSLQDALQAVYLTV